MTTCRVCGETIATPAYETPAPALTSIMTLLDMPTRVYICESCGHAQGDDIPDIKSFYDTGYRISLANDDHDQIFAVKPDGTIIYRTDHQTHIALGLLDMPQGATVIDYGAAKADTLRKMHAARPDILPHVFDVSSDYSAAWQGWVPEGAQATYSVPRAWKNRFDVATSHFVIEHVADPVGLIRDIGAVLRPGGTLLLSLPNVAANPGDMTVADHLSHFSEASLRHALAAGGFLATAIDSTSFPGAFFAVATKCEGDVEAAQDPALIRAAVERGREICTFWEKSVANLDRQAERFRGRKAAIYGAGFYGSWIFSRIGNEVDLTTFLDRNPHLQGNTHFGAPVVTPEEISQEIEALFVGLNPLKARDAISVQPWLHRPGLQHIWLD